MEPVLTEKNFIEIIDGLLMLANSVTKGSAHVSTLEERNSVTYYIHVSINEVSHVIRYQIFKKNIYHQRAASEELISEESSLESFCITSFKKEYTESTANISDKETETIEEEPLSIFDATSQVEVPLSFVINKKSIDRSNNDTCNSLEAEEQSDMINQKSCSNGMLTPFVTNPYGKTPDQFFNIGTSASFVLNSTNYDITPTILIHENSSVNEVSRKEAHSCSYCEEIFIKRNDLEVHLKTHTNERPLFSEHCIETFSNIERLKLNEINQHNVKAYTYAHTSKISSNDVTADRPYKCSYCEKSFRQSYHLKGHELIHTGEMPYECSYCSKRFNRLSNMKCHERMHTGERPYKCSFCDKAFANLSSVKCHEKLHTDQGPFLCSYCSKAFTQLVVKNKHEKLHSDEKPHKCNYCSKSYILLGEKNRHEKMHAGERPYKCNYCPKAFPYLKLKTYHERMHTGERPFKCSYCDKAFTRSSVKNQHEKYHTGEKPYKCSYCEKAFVYLGEKKRHEIVHTGERPYKCNYCEETFTRLNSKKRHERLHTGLY